MWADDCVIFAGDRTEFDLLPFQAIGFVFGAAGIGGMSVYYVSRNVTNYTGIYIGPVTEMSGVADSTPALGVAGFGLLPTYELIPPFDYPV